MALTPHYRDLVARHVTRSVSILACYRDFDTAAALFAANPALADDPEALKHAVGNGDEAFVRLLLRYQPDLPRRVSVAARTRELMNLLFEHGLDPNRRSWLGATPLHWLAEHGHVEQAAMFLDRGADIHARDVEWCSTPLGFATRAGQTAMVEFLLSRGASPTLPDDPPWATPLAWATRRGHADIVRILTAHERSQAAADGA